MIYYFSGTKNSRYAALRLGSLIEEEVRFIPSIDVYEEKLKPGVDKSLGFVFPVYAWGVPPIVVDFIQKLPESMVEIIKEQLLPVWCVATCGDETGMAVEMLRKCLLRRGIELKAAWSIIMPNVYVLLPGFGVDSKEIENRKLSEAVVRVKEISMQIKGGEWKEDVHLGSFPRIKTAICYPFFKWFGMNTKKWHHTDACIGCGKCVSACPVGNITLSDGRPVWGNDCTSCCACFHVCPVQAAQYGRITKNAGQYKSRISEKESL